MMRSLMRELKRRRTSSSGNEAKCPSDGFELQTVPHHKKRNHKPEPPSGKKADEREEAQADEEGSEPALLEPPVVILTTPEGLDIDTLAYGLMEVVDESSDVEDEWGTLTPPPLLAEPPKTPTKRRPAPPRPERPEDLSLNTFVLGPPEPVVRLHDRDCDTTLVSPFADPGPGYGYGEGDEVTSSWWSWSSSDDASSDSSSSSSSDAESDEMDLQYTKHTAGKTLYAQLTDGFVSFPALSPDGSDDLAMRTFLDELDEDDVRDAEDLLKDFDGDFDGDEDDRAAEELIKAVTKSEGDWTNAFSRPVPRWLWIQSSNSYPVCHLGPNDLRHGHSKLRQAMSLVDETGSDTGRTARSSSPSDRTEVEDEDEVAKAGVVYL